MEIIRIIGEDKESEKKLVKEFASKIMKNLTPIEMEIDHQEVEIEEDWLNSSINKASDNLKIEWDELFIKHTMFLNKLVIVFDDASNEKYYIREMSKLDYRISNIQTFRIKHENEYRSPGFRGKGTGNDWILGFKKSGFDQVVSRRWLKYGPWLTVELSEDECFVIFCDIDECEKEGSSYLEDAKIGHERMGVSDTGGIFDSSCEIKYDLEGIYLPDEQVMKVIVAGREVSQKEMLDAAIARKLKCNDPDRPIKKVAYIFMDENDAKKHLHELWLREHECWAIVEGKEVRLDENYDPPVEKPQWVNNLKKRMEKELEELNPIYIG